MKMKFWQKTYILTLILFLLCLNVGIFSLAYYTFGKSVSAAEQACASEQYYIVKSYERDKVDVAEANEQYLMQTYCDYYAKRNVLLMFVSSGETVYSSFPEGFELTPDGEAVHAEIDGIRHILITSDIDGSGTRMLYGKDVHELDDEFRSISVTYVFTSVGVSLFLAVCLFFVLKKLSVPLNKLRDATEKLANGEKDVAADESGNDEFSLLAHSFNTMVGKINEQMSKLEENALQKQRLVDNMAHELRTPLTAIHGYGEYLRDAVLTEEERIEAAGYVVSESERLQKISEKLLDTAYIRENTLKTEKCGLLHLLTDVCERLGGKASARNISLSFGGDECFVSGDKTLLSMLFYNLADNAIKACTDGGKVSLCCDGASVVVADNGKGMTAEQLTHITEPFYRTDKSRSRAEGGAGLGLALCRQIADAHGAEMKFESEIGKGTKVTVGFTTCL